MSIKGVIFDLDGVILSTDKYHFSAWKSICEDLGIHVDDNLDEKLRGVGRMDSLNIILGFAYEDFTPEEKVMLAERKNKRYIELLNDLSPDIVDKNVITTLKYLKARNIKTAIASSSKNARMILRKVLLFDIFDIVVDGNDIRRSKPDPEVFLSAQKKLKLKRKECLIVEDAETGVLAAKNAGIRVALIGKNKKGKNQEDYIIGNLNEVLKLTRSE